MKEKCGVLAAYSFNGEPVSESLVKGLEALQHRGQESWGIKVHGYDSMKRMGLVFEGYNIVESEVKKMKSHLGIAHVRYSTKGKSDILNAHPLQIGSYFSIAQNGTIANVNELYTAVSKDFDISRSTTDTYLLGLRLLQIYRRINDWFSAFEELSESLDGSFSLTFLTDGGEVFAARDRRGFRPLCLGRQESSGTYFIASESCALAAVGAEFIRDIEPGEILRINKEGIESRKFNKASRCAHCPFEYTYFANPSSRIDGIDVYKARKSIGRVLAKKYNIDADAVIPVPDSARPAALGYSEESGVPLEEGLMKDRYRKKGSIRSFIEPTDRRRENIVKQIITIESVVKNKDIVVVDDSIVRGTSSSIISKALRKACAKKISLVITFPPISFPCYMGIDFPTMSELIT